MDTNYEQAKIPNIYYDRRFNIESVKILPGEFYVTSRNLALVTVLGSCVAACINDPKSGIGGMNHFMLPDRHDDGQLLGASARYGSYAMEMMINQLLKMGARRSNLQAKVFGGGKVLRGFTVSQIGERNSHFVLDYLHTEGIPVVAQDLLDNFPRKVYFFPSTGKVLVKKLRDVHNDTIIEREQAYSSRLKSTSVQGDVELF